MRVEPGETVTEPPVLGIESMKHGTQQVDWDVRCRLWGPNFSPLDHSFLSRPGIPDDQYNAENPGCPLLNRGGLSAGSCSVKRSNVGEW